MTERLTVRQTETYTYGQTGSQTDRQTMVGNSSKLFNPVCSLERETERERDRQTDRETQRDRQRQRQTDRKTYREGQRELDRAVNGTPSQIPTLLAETALVPHSIVLRNQAKFYLYVILLIIPFNLICHMTMFEKLNF